MRFVDDFGKPVMTITAEQHALDHPQHMVSVTYEHGVLRLRCMACGFNEEQGYTGSQKPAAHRTEQLNPVAVVLEYLQTPLDRIAAALEALAEK